MKFDIKSLKFRLWTYFLLFAGLLMIILWVLQVFFLSNYYQEMKIRETETAANRIETLYDAGNLAEIRGQITDIYRSNDMYIEIQTESGLAIYIPNIEDVDSSVDESADAGGLHGEQKTDADAGTGTANTEEEENVVKETNKESLEETTKEDTLVTPHLSPSTYKAEIDNLRKELMRGDASSFSKQVTDQKTGLITLEYAAYLTSINEDRNILYVFSPLYPMQSTIDILKSQLIYITIIAMIMAFLVSLYLSKKITDPLVSITESAAKLGEGEYGIVFDGGQYSETVKLADTLTYTSLELAKADNLQKDVIANVSHDLRTPLTMVVSYAEMIRDLSGDDPVKRNQHLGVIIDEAGRLNQLVTDLLEISRMQSGVLDITVSEFSLKETIEELLQAYTGFVEREGFKLVFISSGQGIINADRALIKQVIDNLVSNAFKYSGRDRTVEVKMFDEGEYVRCEVSDHGIGITKKDLKHIWERYYRASTNYHRSDSTGLGLSIVKQTLILHNANFGVESALKKGSTFWFEIRKSGPEPVVTEAEAEDAEDAEAAEDADSAEVARAPAPAPVLVHAEADEETELTPEEEPADV